MQNLIVLLEENPIIVGGQDEPATARPTAEVGVVGNDTPANAPTGNFFTDMGGWVVILMYAAILGALYFFTIRPQRKRQKQMEQMQAELRAGDNIVTASGMFGKITEVGHDCFIVEFGTNKGVKIPVRKSEVVGIKTPNINPPTTPNS